MKHWILAFSALFAISTAANAATLPPLNPDTEPNRIEWWQVEGKFGPMPEIKAGTKVGAVAKTLTNEYWRLLAEGYGIAGQEMGVEVTIGAAGNESGQLDQLNIAETMIDDECSAILASPQSDSNLLPAFEKATRLGIPFINVNDAVFPTAINYIGTVARDNGVRAAKYYIERFPQGGKFAVIEGQAGVFAARQRTQGFHETLAALGGDKYEIVASVPGNWDRQLSYDKADTILIQHPDLLGFYCNNDTMALGVIEAVKDRGRMGETLVIGTDGISAAYDSINKGELTATVDSFPVLTGMVAMDTALRLLAGQDMPRVVATPQALITKENYSRYKEIDIEEVKANLLEDAKQ
ncbi:MAG: substrate-binding domain-containing protein [Planctomycetaceae bacterium]|nr:substrate-binding domain-containing protein [Planctomycetaceae bacterium]